MFLANKLNKGGGLGGYQISRSLRFNSADSAYLNRTPATTTNRTTFTWSGWIKRTTLGGQYVIYAAEQNDNLQFWVQWDNDTINVFDYQSAYNLRLITTAIYRDPSAWYHIVIAVDTTQATSSNRIKLYVNGVQVTSFTTETYPSQNYTTMVNYTSAPNFLGKAVVVPRYLPSYMTEVNFIDGQQLTPSSFGETNAQTGVWQPKAFAGTYGTNGFYLNFSDNSNTTAATLGADYSGNGNNWTPNNFSVTAGAGNDSLVDSPTSYGVDTGVGGSVRGNYCTFNPLFKLGGTTASTWALNGNLQAKSDADASMVIYGTMGLDPSTKFYNEFTMTNTVEAGDHVGIVTDIQAAADGGTCVAYRADGQKIVNGTVSSYGASYTDNDVIGIAVNLVDNQVTFYKNGTSQGAITGVTSGTYFHRVRFNNVAGQQTEVYGNWGQRAFAYTAPSGFKALCTQNLPTPTIGATTATQANTFFAPALYTGNDGVNTVTTGIDMATSGALVWIKNRSAAVGHILVNPVAGYNKYLQSNTTAAEDTFSFITATSSTGFTMNTGSSAVNGGAGAGGPFAYVAWNWKANGSGSSNTAGSITSTVSANTTSGFSVVTYTGTGANATVGHGLGVAPSMVIVKRRDTTANWEVRHLSIATANSMRLNLSDAEVSATTVWNNTAPSSTVFSIGTSTSVNASAGTYVAYCFAPIAGYSAFGSYTGNGSVDGPFVFTGMRPAYVMVKRTDANGDWRVWDTTREAYNVMSTPLYPNDSGAEASSSVNNFDVLSNGFKVRNATAAINANGGAYIFMAFASSPFKFSLAR